MSKTLKKAISLALISGALVASVGGTALAKEAGGKGTKTGNGSDVSNAGHPGQGSGATNAGGDGGFDCSNAPWCN